MIAAPVHVGELGSHLTLSSGLVMTKDCLTRDDDLAVRSQGETELDVLGSVDITLIEAANAAKRFGPHQQDGRCGRRHRDRLGQARSQGIRLVDVYRVYRPLPETEADSRMLHRQIGFAIASHRIDELGPYSGDRGIALEYLDQGAQPTGVDGLYVVVQEQEEIAVATSAA